MPAKRPSGARSETVRCEFCGEDYAITYKRCPFCEEDEPTRIFRRPQVAPPSSRPVLRQTEEPDEYEELLNRRPPIVETDSLPRRKPSRRALEEEDELDDLPARRRSRYDDDEDEYEAPRRRRRDDDYDDEDDDDYYEPPRRQGRDGGKRLVTNERGGGYRRRGPGPAQIIGAVLSVALVAAAVYIVFLIVKPLFGKDDSTPPSTPAPTITATVSPSPTVEPSEEPGGDAVIPSVDPGTQPPVIGGEENTPPPVTTTIPAGQTATGFSLGKTEFTLSNTYPTYQFKVTFTPEGSTGSITWHSSKPNVVSVDANGKVTALAQGVTTITATMAGGYTRECMVRSTFGGTPAGGGTTAPSVSPSASATPQPSVPPAGKLSFNVSGGTDFTLSGVGDSWPLKVKNAVGTPTWSIEDSSIATISDTGRVTAVAKGTTKITAKVDGQTLECTVRVSIP